MFVVRFRATMEVLGKFHKYSQVESFITEYLLLYGDRFLPTLKVDHVENFRGRYPR